MDLRVIELLLALVFFVVILVKSADLITDVLVKFARNFKLSAFFVGFVLLSLISSIPEISIVISSNKLIPELSAGNLLGAKLVILSLLGGVAVIRLGSIVFTGRFGEVEILTGLIMMLLMVLFTFDAKLTTQEGLILIIAYGIYILLIAKKFKTLPHIPKSFHINHIVHLKMLKQDINKIHINASFFLILIKIIIGGFGAVFASSLIVETTIAIGSLVNISEALIGLLVLSIGTNLTEITVLLKSNILNEDERKLTTGNIIGSATINSFIYGLLIIMSGGIELTDNDFIVIIPVMVILSLVIISFMFFAWTGKRLSKTEGWLLISLYLAFLITELIIML